MDSPVQQTINTAGLGYAELQGPKDRKALAEAQAAAASAVARGRAQFNMALPGVIAQLRAGTITKAEAARALRLDPVELVGLMGKHGL